MKFKEWYEQVCFKFNSAEELFTKLPKGTLFDVYNVEVIEKFYSIFKDTEFIKFMVVAEILDPYTGIEDLFLLMTDENIYPNDITSVLRLLNSSCMVKSDDPIAQVEIARISVTDTEDEVVNSSEIKDDEKLWFLITINPNKFMPNDVLRVTKVLNKSNLKYGTIKMFKEHFNKLVKTDSKMRAYYEVFREDISVLCFEEEEDLNLYIDSFNPKTKLSMSMSDFNIDNHHLS